MNRLASALIDLGSFLESQSVPYMVIGGFANLHWGNPRLTQDLDLTVNVPEEGWPRFLATLEPRYRILVPDPREFVRRTRVLPVAAGGGVRVDLIFAALSFELEALERALTIPLEGGSVRICTAEDLILHKVISERPRDQDDVEGIVMRQGRKLDLAYVTPRVRELASALDRPDIEARYRSCLVRAGLESA